VDVAIALLTLALVALVVRFVSGPLRGRRAGGDVDTGEGHGGGRPAPEDRGASSGERAAGPAPTGDPPGDPAELEALEAAREAKYREIRDCELDFRTGKLSREDYEAIDAQLRAEAIEILDRLERARPA
jgi:hypothetical protein